MILESTRKINRYTAARQYQRVENQVRPLLQSIFDTPQHLGLDIDGTIDENPQFFRLLTRIWPGKITIITLRGDNPRTREYLDSLGIIYDQLFSVKRLGDKAQIIINQDINIYIDAQDECLNNIPQNVTVLKIKNDGNMVDGKWLCSRDTATFC
jgi:hypothetical protein